MKALARNKQTFYYALFEGLPDELDEYGLYTGNQIPSYTTPVEAKMNISPSYGRSALEAFGINETYDKVLVTDDMDCPIKEDSILWINTPVESDGESLPNDYVVTRVARSLNSIVIGATKVDKSAGYSV